MHALRDGEQEGSSPQGAQSAPVSQSSFDPGNQAWIEQMQPVSESFSLLQAAEEEVEAIPAAPLSAAQVNEAVSYHRSQPWKYGPNVMNDIQRAVGAPVTGQADEATVQGIARRQAEINRDRRPTPPLAVDGKAGPRTLPALVPMGLATDEQIDAYVADVEGKREDLDKADTDTRKAEIQGMINARLRAVGVPEVEIVWATDDAGQRTNDAANVFVHSQSHWHIELQAKALDDVGGGAALVYHEARHAEQQFQICRMRAAELGAMSVEDKAVSISLKLEVPLHVARKAAEDPLTPGTTEYTIARNWHDPEPGRTFSGPSPGAQALVKGIEEYLQGKRSKDSLEPLYEQYVHGYEYGYRDIPTEWDAFFVSDKVGDKLGVEREPLLTLDELIAQVSKSKGLPVPGSPTP